MNTTNLLTLAQNALGGDFSKLAGSFLGESPSATQTAVSALLPAVLGGIAQKGATPEGASSLMSLINSANLDTRSVDNVAGLFSGGGSQVNELLKQGTSRLVPALFGDKTGSLVNALSSASGVRTSSATSLIAMIVPIVLTLLKKLIGERGLDASSLSSMLSSQGPSLSGALDSRITGALGYASPAAFLSGLGGRVADATRGVSAGLATATGATMAAGAGARTAAMATTTAASSGLWRWLPWVIGAALLLFLWNLFSGRSVPTPATVPAASTPAASTPTPAAATVALPAKVYFETGAAAIDAEASKTIARLADVVKKENVKVGITGYTDKTGDTAKNQELANNRAAAVYDALKAAGVSESSMQLRPTAFVEIGAPGSDAEARRVEISRQ